MDEFEPVEIPSDAKQSINWFKKLRGTALVGIGYMLSPLSWWNDLFFNLPISYVFAYSLSWLFPDSFFLLTVIGYWLSNILGILMMQFGVKDMLFTEKSTNFKKDLILGLVGSTIYTIVIIALIYFHVLDTPEFISNS